MNKKITPRVIKMIVIQSIILIVAVTTVGAAVNVHSEYKNTGKTVNAQVEITTIPGVNTTNNSDEMSKKNEDTTAENETTVSEEKTKKKQNVVSNYKYSYAGFNPQIINIDASSSLSSILLNGTHVLPEGYEPTLAEAVKGSGKYLDYRVAPYYQAMYDKALEDGIELTPVSGYRSYDLQVELFEDQIQLEIDNNGLDKTKATVAAATEVMIPGGSEHNAGLAMDICSLSESFEDTDEAAWLRENAADFGFILRYPKDAKSRAITKVIYEPWHYRFVGVEAAKDITAKGVTLEEYLNAN
ncbi:MAG TPA: M15 family metallopeptidase [Oscillospiraceae bacterium]|nr:M15 family metallopeptidase [Oscillospiraceae bacterium]